ncbi:MAG: hypothetical protein KAG97_11225 [Victivallales bacterium]|nr:hypothetical protein [Victivallales bacterium]
MALCYESRIFEWLLWNSERMTPSKSDFIKTFRKRHTVINKRYGLNNDVPREFFRLTFWGKHPSRDDIDLLSPECEISKSGKKLLESWRLLFLSHGLFME